MGRRVAERVAIACDVPASAYGSSSTGVTDGMLATMRRAVAATMGPLGGRSVSGRLLMGSRDPGITVTVGAIVDWTCAWWDGLLPHDEMVDALKHAQKTVGLSARPNVAVRGGAGAFVAAMRRLAWAAPRADVVKTRDGTLLFFGEGPPPEGTWAADPRTVKRWAMDDYEISVMAASSIAQDMNHMGGGKGYGRSDEAAAARGVVRYYGEGEAEAAACGVWRRAHYECEAGLVVPWIWPMARAAQAAKRRGMRQGAASLRACVEGGWWTQSRLHARGIAASAMCRCGDDVGTMWHKLGCCSLAEAARAASVPQAILRLGKRSVWDPLFSRGVPARPKVPRRPGTRSWWRRCSDGAEQVATGTVFTDGASQGWFWKGSRAAWAAVAVDKKGVVLWRMQGILGEPHPTILRAELTALRETLRIAAPPLKVYVDNKQVVDGVAKGMEYCVSSTADAADIWREVWHRINELGAGVEVIKVRAHTSWFDVVAGRIDPFLRWGNFEADRSAKEALQVAVGEAPHHAYNAQLARAFLWAKWVVSYAASWVDDTTHSPEGAEEAVGRTSAQRQPRPPRGTLPHEVWQTASRVLCRRCGREEATDRGHGGFRTEPCRGSAAGRALAAALQDKNQIWYRTFFTVADMVRRGASLVARSAIPLVLVDLGKIDKLNITGEDCEAAGVAAAAAEAARKAAAEDAEREAAAVADGALERNVRRRTAVPTQDGRRSGGDAAEDDGADGEGRRVRPRREAADHGQGMPRPTLWFREPSWLPEWMPRLPPVADGTIEEGDHDQRPAEDAQGMDIVDAAGEAPREAQARGQVGHELRITGHIVWCIRCAGYAARRWGVRLRGACRPRRGDATRRRIELLQQGRHPITGLPLL